jgi:toxin ParE1/3/4
MKIIWSETALKAIEDIFLFVFSDNSTAAYRIIERIEDKVNYLSTQPYIGRYVSGDLRELIVVNYPFTILYEVGSDNIKILNIFHNSQDWKKSIL